MPISRIGASTVEATTITIPAHQVGDLIIIFAFRDGSTTNPTVGLSGGTTITNTTDGTSCSVSAAWKMAQSTGETSGTWTNATDLAVVVYRGVDTTRATPIGTFQPAAGTTNTVTYAAVNGVKKDSWIVAFAGHRNANTTIETAPTSLGNRSDTVASSSEIVIHDSDGVWSESDSFTSRTVALSGTASGWQTMVIEIFNNNNTFENFKKFRAPNGISANIEGAF